MNGVCREKENLFPSRPLVGKEIIRLIVLRILDVSVVGGTCPALRAKVDVRRQISKYAACWVLVRVLGHRRGCVNKIWPTDLANTCML